MANENWKETNETQGYLYFFVNYITLTATWKEAAVDLLMLRKPRTNSGERFFPEWPPGRSCISILVKWALFIGNTEGNHNVTNVYQLTRQKCLHQCQLSTCTQSLQWFCKLLSDLVHKLLLVMIASFVFVRRLPFLCELNSWGDKLRWLVGIRGRVVNFLDWNTSSP